MSVCLITVLEILGRCSITEAAYALTGIKPRRTGRDTARMPAIWRAGEGLNVSLDDSRGVWHDFATNEGGGILDLVVRVRCCSRADALRWVAELVGVQLDNKPLSSENRRLWKAEQRAIKRDLLTAGYWRRATVSMTEDLLVVLKTALLDPTLPEPEIGEICGLEALLGSLRHSDGAALVKEYRWWVAHCPDITAAMVRTARGRERSERRALRRYIELVSKTRGSA